MEFIVFLMLAVWALIVLLSFFRSRDKESIERVPYIEELSMSPLRKP